MTSHDHIVKSFGEELQALRGQVGHMGELVLGQVDAALRVLREHDSAGAADVIAADREIDACERAVEKAALRIIALRRPVAQDLRVPVTAMKMAHSLERTGDLAKNMAKRVREFPAPDRKSELTASMAELGRLVRSRLTKVLAAYAAGSAEMAMEVWRSDAEIDTLADGLFRAVLSQMARAPEEIGYYAHLLFVARNLERLGDHATNLAEAVRYEATGEDTLEARPRG